MAQLEKGQAIEENQTRDAENTRARPNFSNMTHERAHDTDVDIETGPEAANRGSLVTTSSSTMVIVDIGVNRARGSSFKVKIGEIQNLVFGTAMGILALIMQIFSFTNLPQQFILQSVIVSATSVSVVFSVSVVVDILRGVPASSLRPSIYVALVGLLTSFLTYITALSIHHFLMIIWIYVLVCLSIFGHFILLKIVKAPLTSPSLAAE